MSEERVLVVEDDEVVLFGLEARLRNQGYVVLTANNANDAITMVRAYQPDLMVLDLTLIDGDAFSSFSDGFAFLHWLRRSPTGVNFPVIVHTGDNSPNLDARAKEAGIRAVFHKGEDFNELLEAIRQILDERAAEQANTAA